MINRLTNPRPSVLPDKLWFDTSQDWEVLGDDFDSVSLETIPDATLQALGFHYFPLGYLEKGAPRFVDVTDKPELAIKEPESNIGPITDSEDEKTRKVSERAAKRKARRDNLNAPMRKALAAGSAAFLLSCPPMPGLLSGPLIPSSSSGPLVPGLLSLPMPTPSSPPMPAPLSLPMPALSSPPMLALSSRSVLGPTPTRLTSSALKTFKQALSDESLGRQSTSPCLAELLCLFPTLGPLPKKSNCKRLFDTAFINSLPLARNHTAEEVDLSFGKCRCPAPVKLNQLWQLELLDRKPVYIIEAIPLTAALFWEPLFTPCPCHTMKLASKLGLRTWGIASEVIKERIEAV